MQQISEHGIVFCLDFSFPLRERADLLVAFCERSQEETQVLRQHLPALSLCRFPPLPLPLALASIVLSPKEQPRSLS